MKLGDLVEQVGGWSALQQRLENACSTSTAVGAVMTLVGEDDSRSLAVGLDRNGARLSPTTRLETGCAIKIFVAALMAALIRSDAVRLDDEITQYLSFESDAARQFFDGVLVRHLLSHADGIGYRPLGVLPMTPAGFVDLAALTQIICADARTFRPGSRFSHSHCGFGLLAAIIEKALREPFAHALQTKLLQRLRSETPIGQYTAPQTSAKRDICAATGNGFALSPLELGDFLRFHLNPGAFDVPLFRQVDTFSLLFEPQIAYPGWSVGMTGAALGWKIFPGGWVGHNGTTAGRTWIIRLDAQRKTAFGFFCFASLPVTYALLSQVLASFLPELSMNDGAPRMLSDAERQQRDVRRYICTFGNKARTIAVSAGAPHGLEVTIRDNQQGVIVAKLLSATQEMFFIPPPNAGTWFIQYLCSDDDGEFDLLWDGWNLWNRIGAPADASSISDSMASSEAS
jgi:CubicO group peptidase (beta-lactamase class C family)